MLNLNVDAVSVSSATYGQGSGPIHISGIECTGAENSILMCRYDSITSMTCNHSNDASVQCRIRDVTPPTLQFDDVPQFSTENINISWTYNEEATSLCTFQTSSTVMPIDCSNDTVTFTNLIEGFYSLYVQGTDLSNNTAASVRVSWSVDLTPPVVIVTSLPPNISRRTQWLFQFRCTNEFMCTFMCSVHMYNSSAQFKDCSSGQLLINALQNDIQYEFVVFAIDFVGNTGHPTIHRWTVDTEAPVLSVLSDVTLSCSEDFSPAAIGTPTARDNQDSAPTLVHRDEPAEMCSIRRIWNATDRAGNSAILVQTITITSPQPPRILAPTEVAVPCGSVEDALNNAERLDLIVIHPCDRPVVRSFMDSAPVDRCGFTFTRTLIVQDDCGTSNTLQQTIRILDQQLPDSPANGQVNVKLNEPLLWPPFPGATSYRVYVWLFGRERPLQPTAVLGTRMYIPPANYPPGTRLLWQIEYVTNANATTPSPIWGFETQSFPDLTVIDVQIPSIAFSGQQLDISWTVLNVGNLSVRAFAWSDYVHLEETPEFTGRRRVAQIQQRRFVDPQDGYSSQATISLAPNDIGAFYIFVIADGSRQVNDIDRRNNIRSSTHPVQINLTPPPNIEVEQVVTPRSTFSGEAISVRWTVRNSGIGITGVELWYDRLYLSMDDQLDSRNDRLLGTYRRRGTLGVGMSYSRTERVAIPNAIFGNYSIIVTTDVFNSVYEHFDEDDNSRASPPFRIILSPPPDLIVSSFQVESVYRSGDIMSIIYTVENVGAGAPFETYWRDQVTLTDTATERVYILASPSRYDTLQPGDAYNNIITYIVPPSLSTGHYNLSIHTDFANQVFEFDGDQNNVLRRTIYIEKQLSDLVVSSMSTELESTPQGNIIQVNYTILNQGRGPTVGTWLDRAGISFQPQFFSSVTTFLQQFVHTSALLPNQSRSQMLIIHIPQMFAGDVYLHVQVDYNRRIIEDNEMNNVQTGDPLSLPPIFADLDLVSFIANVSSVVIAGDMITVEWTVINIGSAEIETGQWTDSVLLVDEVFQSSGRSRSFKLEEFQQRKSLLPQDSYKQSAVIQIPVELSGNYHLVVSINNGRTINENSMFSNNLGRILLTLNSPPSPDFRVSVIKFTYYTFDDRILSVEWGVRNTGNSMKERQLWTDQVYIHSGSVFDRQLATRLGEIEVLVGLLESQNEYFLSASFILPVNVAGDYYVYIETDSGSDIMELNGEDNNIKRSTEIISVPLLPLPRLAIKINDAVLPDSALSGDKLQIDYVVTNIGDSPLNLASWLDGLYLVSKKLFDRNQVLENGILLTQVLNNRNLDKNGRYSTSVTITVPHAINEPQFLAVLIDINNNLEEVAKEQDNRYLLEFTQIPILIEQGPLPDLAVIVSSNISTLIGGQPVSVTYTVKNVGENRAVGMWFEAVYLSDDALLDPFDTKLRTVQNLRLLEEGENYTQSVEVFVPFDIPSANYYLFFEVDGMNRIAELNISNNIAQQIVMIIEAVSTDLLVSDVFADPTDLSYGEDITFDWSLRNTGTLPASAYKCDSVYLSEDNLWDIGDLQLGSAQCGRISIEPFEGDSANDASFQQTFITPFVAQQNYTGIVRTRSNLRDPSLENNIGIASMPLSISALSLTLNVPSMITLTPGEELVYRIDGVPSEETLVATLTTSEAGAYHDLFLRHQKPPTGFNFDATSKSVLSFNQRAVVRNSMAGTYYLRIKSNGRGNDPYQVEVLIKIAQFEVLSTSPDVGAPLGNVTIHFSGTAFNYNIRGELVHESTGELYMASKTYWFSSEEVHATFNTVNMSEGTYSPRLQDMDSGTISQMNGSFCIQEGIPGKLTVDVKFPRPLRAGSNGRVPIILRNTGDTDVIIPTVIVSTGGRSRIKPPTTINRIPKPIPVPNPRLTPGPDPQPILTPGSLPIPTSPVPEQQSERIPVPPVGPGGTLPHGGSAETETEVVPDEGFAGTDGYNLYSSGSTNEDHLYAGERDNLQPPDTPDGVWDMVWNNFMESVGQTWDSFNRRMSDVVTQMSLAHQRMPYNTRDLVDFQIRIADGLLSGTGGNLDITDLIDSNNNDFLPLTMRRMYNHNILKRRTAGPMGMGWILPHWETMLKNMTESRVTLSRGRTVTHYTLSEVRGVYTSIGGDTIAKISDGFVYEDIQLNEVYTFDNITGKLKIIDSSLDNSSISVSYADDHDRYPSLFKHSSGKSMTVTYTDKGNIRTIDLLDENGNVEQSSFYMYDSGERCLTVTTVASGSATYSYSEDGDLMEVMYTNGNRRTFEYDEYSRLSGYGSISPVGEVVSQVSMIPEWNGKVTMTVQPMNKTIEAMYNTNGEVVFLREEGSLPLILAQLPGRSTLLFGDKELYTEFRDEMDNTVHIIDANRNEIVYKYGDLQELRSVIDSSRNVYSVNYDEEGRVTGFRNPDGNKTTINYSSDNLLSSISNPDGSSIKYIFDSNSQLIQKDVDGEQVSFEYDSNFRIRRGTNKEGSVDIAYDSSGRPTEVSYSNGHTLSYGYNKLDQRTYIADGKAYNISYHYDGRNRLSEIRQSLTEDLIVQYEYSDTNNLVMKSLGNGAYSTYKYEGPVGQLSEVRNFLPGGEESDYFIYCYDKQGRITTFATKHGNWTYRYDPANQLIKWITPDGDYITYTYDSRGNRLVQAINDNKETYNVNIVNQYLQFGDMESFTYDPNGHLRQKITGGRRERFSFSVDGKLTETETPNLRCSYRYDAFGNLFKKNCSDSSSYEYLVDPYGRFGADIVAEISASGTQYFVNSFDQGLVAALNSVTRSLLYYEFDGAGSVVGIVDGNGVLRNSYEYDPFGKVIRQVEQVRNIHTYIGSFGVIADGELQHIYMMRGRHYDAQHGRFISQDPIGLSGRNPNLYVYAFNSPLLIRDPTGQIPIPVISAVVSIAAYSVVQVATGEKITLAGVVGAGISGTIGGFAGTGLVLQALLNTLGSFIGQAVGDMIIDEKPINIQSAVAGSIGGTIGFGIAKKLFGPIASSAIGRNIGSAYTKSVKPLIEQLVRRFGFEEAFEKFFKAAIPGALTGKGLDELFKTYLMWLQSRDPNDMLGPNGFGDAHFIAPDLNLEYTIRFENDPNATAPAQRVFIRHALDDDLDERTFRVGSFGFGDFTRKIPLTRAFLQDTINITESHGVFVMVRGGIDVVSREAMWEFQALDPVTGEPPVDPTVGFLPPNNGTTGQGFVTFSIRADDKVESLSRIDAAATIIFDQNEPIDTPPIFNTIDASNPTLNLTINQELLDTGTLALHLGKSDVGSGVASVDIYEFIGDSGMSIVQPVQLGVSDNVVVLPLSPGSRHQLFASAVDNVGNRQPMMMDSFVIVDVPLLEGLCHDNCSLRGNCSTFGICTCEAGYFGNDCSRDSPLVEPPILELSSPGGIEDVPVVVFLSASPASENTTAAADDELVIYISLLPEGSAFNKGTFNGTVWRFNSTEFGETELALPKHFSGSIVLLAVASHQGVSREGTLELVVEPVADSPTLIIKETCHKARLGTVNLTIASTLVDQDGSESLVIIISDLPDAATLSVGQMKENGEYIVELEDLPELFIEFVEEFESFNLTVSALSTEEMNSDTAYTNRTILIDICYLPGVNECELEIDNCEQLCVDTLDSYTCNCRDGYELDEDGLSCNNVDECRHTTHNCTQVCRDTIGSYECDCFTGYELGQDGSTCFKVEVNECELGLDNCSHICHDTVESYTCTCNVGYTLAADGVSCNDECAVKENSCDQICINTDGSFECACNTGYVLDEDKVSCINVDECELNTDECDQICVDTIGSYECDCLSNFTLHSDGLSCIPGPPFTLSLVNNSPRVEGSTVSIDFAASTLVQSATCFLGKEFMKDCINGSVTFTEVPMGKSYIFRVVAKDVYLRRFVLREQVAVFDSPLILTFINNSPHVEGNNVSLDFITSTPVSSAICYMGRNIVKNCVSGKVEFSDLSLGSYVLKIVLKRPGKRIVERRVLHIVGEESCSVYLINDGVRVDGRNVSVHFTSTGPAESYFCRMDDSAFVSCNSPFTAFNLEEGVHTVRVKTQKCGRGDRRLSFKFTVRYN